MGNVRRQPQLRRFGVALGSLAAAVTLRFLLAPLLGAGEHAHTLTLAAVALAAWSTGSRLAAAVALAGYLVDQALFVDDVPVTSTAGLVGASVYAVSCAAIIGLAAAARRRAASDARRASDEKHRFEREAGELRTAERAARERYEQIGRLTDAVPALIWASDADGACTFVNDEWVAFTGESRQALAGEGWTRLIHPDDREHVTHTLAAATEHCEAFTVLYRMRHQDRSYRWIVHRARPCLAPSGELTGFIGALTDITEEKTAEETLREADRRKDEFLATIAHELRNPLAPIRYAAQILRLKDAPDAARDSARDVIDRQVRLLSRLVDDLLDVSRITLGRLLLQTTEVELDEVIESAVEASRTLIDASRHALSITLPAEPVRVEADPTRLAQVFINLLNNAAKYTPPGGQISLAATREGDTVVVKVKDTGIGIAPEVLPRVFDTFTRIDHSAERAQAGLGIGLSLARHLVELHGGHIEAHSEGPGRGAEFIVTLPACVRTDDTDASNEPAITAETPRGRVLRILVADNNADAAESLSLLLRAAGHETHIAHDGLQAVEASRRIHPDIVLLEIGLPRLNGYEVARAIRARANGNRPRIIALTGWGQGDRHRAAEAGFDKHLTKPVDPVVLKHLVEQRDRV